MLLAIDATQSPITIAVGWDGVVHGHAVGPVQRNAADNLFEIIADAITQSSQSKNDITSIIAITGPGSFTGIRVGLSFAQSFAFAKSIPVYGLTAFEILSFSAAGWEAKNYVSSQQHLNLQTAPKHDKKLIIIESKRTELYAQFYQNNVALSAPLMADVAELTALAVLENTAILAPEKYQEVFAKLPNSFFYNPAELSKLALNAFWQIQPAAQQILNPFYIRPPDAVPQIKQVSA